MTVAPVLALLAAMSSSQGIDTTHERVWNPSGKVPQVTYRPIASTQCRTAIAFNPLAKGAAIGPRRCESAAELEKGSR